MGRGGVKKSVVVSFGGSYGYIYRELQWLKKYYGMERVSDPAFIRWLIHRVYNSVQKKLLSESLGEGIE